jgi:nitrogenase molybdenum-cofactor synthesis protein NifE
MKGLRKYLTPFAPDQSGAVSALYELGGLLVICDAGGCAGNVCGFDEPRWATQKSAVFSAGLRDMDAILGRDDRLVDKLTSAAAKLEVAFGAIIGTPVPAVIGTDHQALCRMAERRSGLPMLAVDTTGMALYDQGAEKAYDALFRRFAEEVDARETGRLGVLGLNPLDCSDLTAGIQMRALLAAQGWQQVDCYGMGAGLDRVKTAGGAAQNLVVSPAGLKAAEHLKQRFGTPYQVADPLAAALLPEADYASKRVLVVHQQVRANSLRQELLRRGASSVTVATWFMKKRELEQPGDLHLREEDDFAALVDSGDYDVLVGDPALWRMTKNFQGLRVDMPHFAVSGKLVTQ